MKKLITALMIAIVAMACVFASGTTESIEVKDNFDEFGDPIPGSHYMIISTNGKVKSESSETGLADFGFKIKYNDDGIWSFIPDDLASWYDNFVKIEVITEDGTIEFKLINPSKNASQIYTSLSKDDSDQLTQIVKTNSVVKMRLYYKRDYDYTHEGTPVSVKFTEEKISTIVSYIESI